MSIPQVEDKKACEHCGEMVTVHPAGRAAHMRKHKNEVVKPDAPKVDLDGLKEEEKAILERALKAQNDFRKAPEVYLSEDSSDENMALVKLYAPHCLDEFDHEGKLKKRAQGHAFFAREDKMVHWASRGYVPQRREGQGWVANSGGDILCVCDRDLYEARERKIQNESRAIVRSAQQDINKTQVDGVEAGDARDLRDTSLKVNTETIEV